MTTFTDLGLGAPLLAALEAEGYRTPTPIQAQAIPHVLAGRDLLGIAQTGTGKTAAFALPMLQRLAAVPAPRKPMSCRALILSPTRELASQIAESFRVYGANLRLSVATVFGGVGHMPQVKALRPGVDVLVATPGRLLDHMNGGSVRLDQTEIFVLDEADQMLDMGFIRDIRRLVAALPKKRQSLFFSATMPGEIGKLAGELLREPVTAAVTPVATTVELIQQRVEFMHAAEKNAALAATLGAPELTRALVFTRTKHGADKVVRYLERAGIPAAAIHGNKSQNQRERALAGFKSGEHRVLIATDIAARGIDIDAVSHVINYHLPNIPEAYVHRIGRTARAGASGIAISFVDNEERSFLRDIERTIRQPIPTTDRRGTIVANSEHVEAPESTDLRPHELRKARPGERRGPQPHGKPRQRPAGQNAQRQAARGESRPAQARPGQSQTAQGGKPAQHSRDNRRGSAQPKPHGRGDSGHKPPDPRNGSEPQRQNRRPHQAEAQSRPMRSEPVRFGEDGGGLGHLPLMRPVRMPPS